MKLKPYPRYKPSGAEWLGNVPAHWDARKLKYLTTINDDKLSEATHPDFDMMYIDIGSIDTDHGAVKAMRVHFGDAPSRARRIVRAGDTIVSTVRTYLRAIATLHNPDEDTVVSTGFAVLRPGESLSPAFLGYNAESRRFVDAVCSRSVGVGYPATNASEIGTIAIALPSTTEQQSITTFLDQETTKIDTLVAKTRTLIERLQEKRRALITETVARGLSPDENLKTGLDPCPTLRPSGVKWLDDVPEHWRVRRLKYCVCDNDKDGVLQRKTNECTHRYLGLEAVESWTGKVDDPEALPLRSIGSSSRCFSRGDVLFGKLRPYLAKSCRPDFDGLCSGEFLVLEGSEDLDNRYLLYLLLSQYMVAMSDASAYGTKMPRTNWQELGSLLVPVPTIREQRAICSFLEDATGRIDDLVSICRMLIDRLREKREALITAAVTGEIDVREAGRGTTA